MKKVHVLSIRPTQFALGMKEVEHKVEHLSKLSAKEFQRYLEDHPLPGVKYKEENHPIDHHHLARAVWEMRQDRGEVWIDDKEDLSHLTRPKLWQWMIDNGYLHPYDQFGDKRNPELLPASIKCLADDPYRSVAWIVRDSGGYAKTTKPFAEFMWANFFRKKIPIFVVLTDFETAGRDAIKLAHSDEAKHLPGWSKKHVEVEKPIIEVK